MDARALTDRIKVAVEATWILVVEAYTSRAWSALGYATWDDYCTREFGTSRLRLPREERQEVVSSLREQGLSIRAIATATSLSVGTVQAVTGEPQVFKTEHLESSPFHHAEEESATDLGAVASKTLPAGRGPVDLLDEPPLTHEQCEAIEREHAEARKITGRDGKQYASVASKSPGRKPLPDSFRTAIYNLGKAVASIDRLSEDDRFSKNAGQIRQTTLHDLTRARDALQRVINQLSN
jgi:hypothetical protein